MNEIATVEVLEAFATVEFEGKEFNLYGDFQNPLFLVKDVAEWIQHSHTSKMVANVDEDEKLSGTIVHAGQKREVLFLTEHGMYEVLMQSRKPIAKEVKKQIKRHLKRIRTEGMTMRESLNAEQKAQLLVSKLDEIFNQQEEEILAIELEIANLEEQVALLETEIEEIDNRIEEVKPYADKYHEFLNEEAFMTVDEFARIMHPRYHMGRNNMYKWMRENRILGTGSKKNMPHRKLVKAGILKLIKDQVFITKKGFDYLCDKLDVHFGLTK